MKRSGYLEPQVAGYKAFIPAPLPPKPLIKIENSLQELLLEATIVLARLDGMATTLPNTDLFISMYVKKEALLSAQIEGTQASLENVFEFEQGAKLENIDDVSEVINYVKALHFGLRELKKIPMSSRLIKKLHSIILRGVRGKHKTPGEFRKTQNWIGPPGSTLNQASFVPPPPQAAQKAMGDLEKYLHKKSTLPTLIDCALIHYQFETIHPFLDGNGRLGRLLITFYLCWKGLLEKPLLYLSFYFKKHRQEYYDRLSMVRESGDYEQWLEFFLKGVIETSQSALLNTKKILQLKEKHKKLLWKEKISSPYAMMLHEKLFYTPLISITDMQLSLDISFQAASNLIGQFESVGIVKEVTGKKREKRYLYSKYLAILSEGTKPL